MERNYLDPRKTEKQVLHQELIDYDRAIDESIEQENYLHAFNMTLLARQLEPSYLPLQFKRVAHWMLQDPVLGDTEFLLRSTKRNPELCFIFAELAHSHGDDYRSSIFFQSIEKTPYLN